MSSYPWPSDDGWPYPDTERETIDLSSEVDDDALSVRLTPSLLNSLDPLERVLIASRYGLGGTPIRSMLVRSRVRCDRAAAGAPTVLRRPESRGLGQVVVDDQSLKDLFQAV